MKQFTKFAYYYDKLNVNYDKDKIIERIKQLLCGCREVVDLCCGTGDVAIALAKSGLKVMGVDVSADMLNVAAQKAAGSAAKVMFVCSDARKFELLKKADAVYSLTDGMNYMIGRPALKEAFCAVNKALKENGKFIFDVSTQYKYENILANNTFTFDVDDVFLVWENAYDSDTRICDMTVTGFVQDKKDTYTRFDETHKQYCYSISEIEQTLEETGFIMENIYSGYDPAEYTPTDERALIVARKK